jgi:hypothetical protein
LQELGWATDRNIQIDYRWAVGQDELYRKYAVELVALQPDVLVTTVTARYAHYNEPPGQFQLCSPV